MPVCGANGGLGNNRRGRAHSFAAQVSPHASHRRGQDTAQLLSDPRIIVGATEDGATTIALGIANGGRRI